MKKSRLQKAMEDFVVIEMMAKVIALGLVPALVLGGAGWIFCNGGSWFVPLWLSYTALVSLPTAYVLNRREKAIMAHVTGLESFYTEREFERRKALRDVRKRGTPASVSCTMERVAAETNLPEISEEYRKENRKGKMLFLMAGVCLLALGIFLLWRAYGLYQITMNAPRKMQDYRPLFPLAGSVLVMLTALFHFLHKKSKMLHLITMLVLLFGAWGTSIAGSVNSYLVIKDVLISFACAVLYALIIYGPFKKALDWKSPEREFGDYKTLQLELFELGLIDEDVLRIRLERLRFSSNEEVEKLKLRDVVTTILKRLMAPPYKAGRMEERE